MFVIALSGFSCYEAWTFVFMFCKIIFNCFLTAVSQFCEVFKIIFSSGDCGKKGGSATAVFTEHISKAALNKSNN